MSKYIPVVQEWLVAKLNHEKATTALDAAHRRLEHTTRNECDAKGFIVRLDGEIWSVRIHGGEVTTFFKVEEG